MVVLGSPSDLAGDICSEGVVRMELANCWAALWTADSTPVLIRSLAGHLFGGSQNFGSFFPRGIFLARLHGVDQAGMGEPTGYRREHN